MTESPDGHGLSKLGPQSMGPYESTDEEDWDEVIGVPVSVRPVAGPVMTTKYKYQLRPQSVDNDLLPPPEWG